MAPFTAWLLELRQPIDCFAGLKILRLLVTADGNATNAYTATSWHVRATPMVTGGAVGAIVARRSRLAAHSPAQMRHFGRHEQHAQRRSGSDRIASCPTCTPSSTGGSSAGSSILHGLDDCRRRLLITPEALLHPLWPEGPVHRRHSGDPRRSGVGVLHRGIARVARRARGSPV